MKRSLVYCTAVMACALTTLLQPAAAADTDAWSNVPQASDDRFTNPKSKLYAGPNGWHNFGEVRADGAGKHYAFKAGLQYLDTPAAFVLVGDGQLQVVTVDFGTPHPAPGVYAVGSKADVAQKTAVVSLADVSNKQLLEWKSAAKAGTVTVSQQNGYLYLKARDLHLAPTGHHNTGVLKQVLVLGFEGAVAP